MALQLFWLVREKQRPRRVILAGAVLVLGGVDMTRLGTDIGLETRRYWTGLRLIGGCTPNLWVRDCERLFFSRGKE